MPELWKYIKSFLRKPKRVLLHDSQKYHLQAFTKFKGFSLTSQTITFALVKL